MEYLGVEVLEVEVLDLDAKEANIRVTREELYILNSSLNEICNGIELFEFQARVGSKRADVVELLAKVGRVLDDMES